MREAGIWGEPVIRGSSAGELLVNCDTLSAEHLAEIFGEQVDSASFCFYDIMSI